ncbi:MAG: hypothetical protein PHU63_00985 [Candidatus ainarchaeum sp.]|nr:hypothetical protein [Candidatus ainarchaeum sp.]
MNRNSKKIKIIHFNNIANVSTVLKKEMEKYGIDIYIIGFENKFNFYSDILIRNYEKSNILLKIYKRIKVLPKIISIDSHILHFNYNSIIWSYLDLILWKLLGKKIIIHRHGSDIRNKQESILVKLLADKILVSTPDLLRYTPTAEWIPNPIDVYKLNPIFKTKNKKVTIVHAPTKQNIKGTDFIVKCMNNLKKKYDFEFLLIENMDHEKALEIYKKADIIIDQIKLGAYGVFSIEGMALGKPVVCYILKDLYNKNCPIVNVNKENFEKKVEELIKNKKLREEIGKKSRDYVEKVHDNRKVSKRYFEIIKEITN